MTHDERISSYIDNELSSQEEQDFLISLAASDGLRRSFRSELVLKNVLHRDEASTNPPRRLRAAVFATLGLAATGIAADNAQASPAGSGFSQAGSTAPRGIAQAGSTASRGLLKALFATKLNILATVASLFVSALAGYGVRTVTAPAPQVIEQSSHAAAPSSMVSPIQQVQPPVVNSQSSADRASIGSGTSSQNHSATAKHAKLATIMHNRIQDAESAKQPVSGTVGDGAVIMNPPVVTKK
jgi:hypothetical protein